MIIAFAAVGIAFLMSAGMIAFVWIVSSILDCAEGWRNGRR